MDMDCPYWINDGTETGMCQADGSICGGRGETCWADDYEDVFEEDEDYLPGYNGEELD